MHQGDPAVGGADLILGYLELDVRGPQHGARKVIRKVVSIEPSFDSPLASAGASRRTSFHSKLPLCS